MSSARSRAILYLVALALVSHTAAASEWVYGNVSIVDDYRAFDPNGSLNGLLITLPNKTWTSGGSAQSVCGEVRFRVVVGQEGVTADVQKFVFAALLAARATGDGVRVYVNPLNVQGGHCAVQIVGIGDV